VSNYERIPRDRMSRRELLRAGVSAGVVAPLGGALAPGAAEAAVTEAAATQTAVAAATAATATAAQFFTAAELALVDELTELIVPADEHSGGARAAGVAAYLDRTLAEKDPKIDAYSRERWQWKDGLARVGQLAREMHGTSFLEATPEQRVAVLDRMAANEGRPKTLEERFFAELKTATTRAYYSSRTGMIEDIGYKGNRVISEFAGTDVSGSESA
jgi:hypothetical protein